MIRPSRHDYMNSSLPVHPMGNKASGAEKTHSPAGSLIPRFAVTETLANAIFSVVAVLGLYAALTWFYYTFLVAW